MTLVSIARAAVRPSVENRADAGALSVSRTALTSPTVALFPEAYMTRTRASGPTSMGVSFQRGALSQEYLPVDVEVLVGRLRPGVVEDGLALPRVAGPAPSPPL